MQDSKPSNRPKTSINKHAPGKNLDQTEDTSFNNSKRKYFIGFLIILSFLGIAALWYFLSNDQTRNTVASKPREFAKVNTPTPTQIQIPKNKLLSNGGYHIFQSFNNCGPAALSMTLRFYGINVSQEELGLAMRPYQVPGGDNDDKSVTLEEVAEKSKEYNLIPYLRPMGNEKLVKQFIANDIPIITRTWLKKDEDIGHFRIIKGYDDSRGIFIQDDSLQGNDLEYAYADFNELWKKFNYEYLVLVPKEKQKLAEEIIGEDKDKKIAWQKAVENSKKQLTENPNDAEAGFNLSVAYYRLGDYQKSVEEFEKVENKLSFRTLWYQIEPILSYYELGNDQRVLEITEQILNNQNRAFSELYIVRGKIYQKQLNNDLAHREFEKAVLYNTKLREAQELLNSI